LGVLSLGLYCTLGDAWGTAVSLNLLGALARSRGGYDEARVYGEEALALFEGLGMARWVARVRAHLGIVAHWRGDEGDAESLLLTALEAHRGMSDQIGSAIVLHWLAIVAADRGTYGRSTTFERDGLLAERAAGAKEALLDGLAGLVSIATGVGRMETAARLHSTVATHRERLGYSLERPEQERYDRAIGNARTGLGGPAFDQAERVDSALSLEDAVAEAIAFVPTSGTIDAATQLGLTAREVEVLRLLAQWRTDREIANDLSMSPKTAGHHVSNILSKLGVANRREAAAFAVREGLAEPPT
jgi:DNA-binding CsgD family transcriptional regulator